MVEMDIMDLAAECHQIFAKTGNTKRGAR